MATSSLEFNKVINEDFEALLDAPYDAGLDLVVDVGGEDGLQWRHYPVELVVGVLLRQVVVRDEDLVRYHPPGPAQHRLDDYPPHGIFE